MNATMSKQIFQTPNLSKPSLPQFSRGQDQHLQGVCRRRVAPHPEGRLQRDPDHGRHGARLLRQLRISGKLQDWGILAHFLVAEISTSTKQMAPNLLSMTLNVTIAHLSYS